MAKTLFDSLDGLDLLEYGAFIPAEVVRDLLGLEMPETGTKAQFDAVSLRELSAIDDVREVLLGRGKYLAGTGGGYRILTPGENAEQVQRYLSHAQNKLRRSSKLLRTMPAIPGASQTQLAARVMMAQSSIRSAPGAR